jgi:two-component system nitrate/nitrite response regulator NarL
MLVDDHVLFREGLKSLLGRLADQVTIHEAGSVAAGFALGDQYDEFSLILLDLNLPGMNGLDGLKTYRQRFPTSPLVILSGVDDEATVKAALQQGAQGFISKSVSADAMLRDLRRVLDGESCWPGWETKEPTSAGTESLAKSSVHLTPRQIEVLVGLCKGQANKEIGRELGMSDNTVSTHIVAIFRALGARSRTEVAFLARKKGLI